MQTTHMQPGERLKLLLVEDNPGDAELARDHLDEVPDCRFDIIDAGDLHKALDIIRTGQIDAVVLDLNLPDSRGLETLSRIRALDEDMAVVVLSGHNDEALRTRVLDAGAEDFISKDEPPSRLLGRSVLYALERSRARQREKQIHRLVSANPDAMIVADQKQVVRFVNDAAVELFAKAREDFLGAPLGFSLDHDQRGIAEIRINRDAETRTAEIRVVDFEWDGQPAFLAALRDVTEQRKLSEQLMQAQRMEAVGQLAGGIAHDFNNLLTVILSYATFVRDDLTEEDARRKDLDDLMRAADRAQALTGQLLAFSRRRSVQPKLTDMMHLIETVQRLLQRALPSNIEITVVGGDGIWPVWVDPAQFEQVLTNLAVNSRDAMPTGGRLTFEIQNVVLQHPTDVLPTGDYLSISATDTGEGIPPEVVKKVFEPFFTTKDVGKGTGLGLAMCHGIIQQAGGDISVDSRCGQGTTMTILLPRAHGIPTEESPRARPATLRGTERILVVEDNPAVLRSTVRILRQHGYTVIEANNGDEARRALRGLSEDVDLVLSDVMMPYLSGPELADSVSISRPGTKVLLMTGYADAGTIGSPTPASGVEILSKPFRPTELLHRVRELLDRDRGTTIQPADHSGPNPLSPTGGSRERT